MFEFNLNLNRKHTMEISIDFTEKIWGRKYISI